MLDKAKERFEAAGWNVEMRPSGTGSFFDVVATKQVIVRRDYTGVLSDEDALRAGAEAVMELARQCGVDLSDLES